MRASTNRWSRERIYSPESTYPPEKILCRWPRNIRMEKVGLTGHGNHLPAIAEVEDIRENSFARIAECSIETDCYIPFPQREISFRRKWSLAQVIKRWETKSPAVTINLFRFMLCHCSTVDHENLILAGHDISSGGLVTTLLEMCFPTGVGAVADVRAFNQNIIETLFAKTRRGYPNIKWKKQLMMFWNPAT